MSLPALPLPPVAADAIWRQTPHAALSVPQVKRRVRRCLGRCP